MSQYWKYLDENYFTDMSTFSIFAATPVTLFLWTIGSWTVEYGHLIVIAVRRSAWNRYKRSVKGKRKDNHVEKIFSSKLICTIVTLAFKM